MKIQSFYFGILCMTMCKAGKQQTSELRVFTEVIVTKDCNFIRLYYKRGSSSGILQCDSNYLIKRIQKNVNPYEDVEEEECKKKPEDSKSKAHYSYCDVNFPKRKYMKYIMSSSNYSIETEFIDSGSRNKTKVTYYLKIGQLTDLNPTYRYFSSKHCRLLRLFVNRSSSDGKLDCKAHALIKLIQLELGTKGEVGEDECDKSPKSDYLHCDLSWPTKTLTNSKPYRISAQYITEDERRTVIYYVTLRQPESEIIDCPSTINNVLYVNKDTSLRCGCRLKDIGFPPGIPEWVIAHGDQILSTQQGKHVMDTTYLKPRSSSEEPQPIYICRGANQFVNGTGQSLRQKIAVPPTSAPVLTVNNVSVNEHVVEFYHLQFQDIRCHVYGGTPLVSQITLTCGKHGGNGTTKATLVLAGKNIDQTHCVCNAYHMSGLYNKTSEFTFRLMRGPFITQFSINHEIGLLETTPNTTILITCQASGSSKYVLEIYFEDTFLIDGHFLPDDIHELSVEKTLTCNDSGLYTCFAKNETDALFSKENMTVLVTCMPTMEKHENVTKSFEPTSDSSLVVKVPVACHPRPYEFDLLKEPNREKRSNDVKRNIKVQDRHTINYERTSPGHGIVVVNMTDLTTNDTGEYILVIRNGIGDGIRYRYRVVVQKTEIPQPANIDNKAAIIGGTIGATIFIIVVAIICVIMRKKDGCLADSNLDTTTMETHYFTSETEDGDEKNANSDKSPLTETMNKTSGKEEDKVTKETVIVAQDP